MIGAAVAVGGDVDTRNGDQLPPLTLLRLLGCRGPQKACQPQRLSDGGLTRVFTLVQKAHYTNHN